MKLDSKIPEGRLEDKWRNYQIKAQLINPANKKKLNVIVVGSGLSGAGAAATLAELGYDVQCFCYQDSARRAHSVAAQGGINAAKNYQHDGDSVWRMFYDTLKGGDFRSREANTYRLAELSAPLIDHFVQQGVPFAREYGGVLVNRSFGGVQVQRTFYARGQTGQQLLLAAYSQLYKMIRAKKVKMFPRSEMIDLVVIDGKAKGIIVRDLVTGELKRYVADAIVLATGGYSRVFRLSTLAIGCNGSAIWKAHKRGAFFAAPSFTQIHPTALPQTSEAQSKLTLMSESLRNDGRIWVPKKKEDIRKANDIPEKERDYYLERRYPSFGNLAPRDIASRAAKERIDAGYGVGRLKNAVYLDFRHAIDKLGIQTIKDRYENLFGMYKKITGIDAYKEPMQISPAAHFSMGGLWVDYELMTTIPGLYAVGECNFSDHGANRLGANSLLQASIDGYFILPNTINNYLAGALEEDIPTTDHIEFEKAEKEVRVIIDRVLNINGTKTVDHFHRELGKVMWQECAMSRNKKGLEKAILQIKTLKDEFWSDVKVTGSGNELNTELEKALRLADFMEMGILMCTDALEREESCGAHFREEFQTEDGEAVRVDENYSYVSAWEYDEGDFKLHKEELEFEFVQPSVRSYK
ncbi:MULTISPECIES: fumarate reductase/succinate dehydrogenase flavoprotein subunit [Flagellimonas]|uniref:succinate dehydrogenase n=3 Tax=Flagellimonas TaxID=444459 RepID=A0A3A1ND72_9FLAO|nr:MULTISPECIES: fumarate reductase/succinate dehydrogenase flavoprotein subunit [Allomuricauda]MBW8242803.1 fumarate reductase/succinate dehydrogenase flavoprotein subunit [Allomuricauda oceani]NDV45003.1 succinate dehydrogenase (quinone) flavoprotein subunit [Allomuricauda sediminis]QII45463.1 fumarate reductase/succinate dehydrogenase flavoprotein subunit [Allomuricauda oceani]RIV42411.1 fumarate reductase/succinate dehydrogenase flavoprotein subunit [Allomuricauda maritima]TXJ91441.1 fumar